LLTYFFASKRFLFFVQQTQEMTGNLAVNKGEYWCPLCRQLANSVIPIPPEEDQYTVRKPLSRDPNQLLKDVADMMVSRPITPVGITQILTLYIFIEFSCNLRANCI
jgi:E3 ubiquitin-protein ligase UBR3